MSDHAKLLLRLFLPFYAIYCVKQGYFLYGNVLEQYGYSPRMIGPLLGVLYVAVMAMRPLGGWILERFGVRRGLVAGGLVCLAGCMLLYFARSPGAIVAGRLLVGAGISVYSTGVFAYQALVVPAEIRAASFAIVVTGGMLPLATVAPIAEWLIARGLTDAYLLMGPLICLLCVWLGARVGPAENEGPRIPAVSPGPEAWGSYGELFQSRKFLVLIASAFFISLVDATIVSISVFARSQGVAVSYYMIANAIAAVLVRAPGARLLNAVPRPKYLVPLALLLPLSLLYLALWPSNVSFLLGGAVCGFGIGAVWPMLLASVSDILPAKLRPKGTATMVLCYDSCWFLTPLLVGYISQAGSMAMAYAILSAVSLVALSVLYLRFWVPLYRTERD